MRLYDGYINTHLCKKYTTTLHLELRNLVIKERLELVVGMNGIYGQNGLHDLVNLFKAFNFLKKIEHGRLNSL